MTTYNDTNVKKSIAHLSCGLAGDMGSVKFFRALGVNPGDVCGRVPNPGEGPDEND